jgi:tetratricopeptide (TPR) repeat protein
MNPRRPLLAGIVLSGLVLAACATPPLKPQGVGDTPAHHYMVGMKLLETADLGQAQQEFERARALAPDYAPAWEGLGLVALARKDLPTAESLLKTAKSKQGKYVPAYLGLARVYSAKGEHDRAQREAAAAVDLEPRNARTHLVLGQVRLAAYDFQRAEISFARALELAPTSSEARREWDRSVRIRQAAPGTMVGKRIALAEPITRGELATLLASEFGIEANLRRKRPEIFDASFRPPAELNRPPAVPATAPGDIAGHWAKNAIDLVTRINLMEPYPDRTFRPDEPMTRAGLASVLEQVLVVAANDPALKTRYIGQRSPFPDVRGDHFAFNAIILVTTRGLMEGDRATGAFDLTRPVSGAEAALAMRKLAELF